MSYRIGSFNLHNLGKTALGAKNPRDLKAIAKIIREEKYDVVALQEILSEGAAFVSPDYAKRCILYELGGEDQWGFEYLDSTTNSSLISAQPFESEQRYDPRGECYAFIWNKKTLRLCTTKVLTPYGEVTRTFYPRMCSVSKSGMIRKPFYGRFTAAGTNVGSNFELRLICVHTYYGKTDSLDDRKRRQHELDVLLKEIYPQICDRRYGDSLNAYTVLLGDYNAEVWTYESQKWQEELKRIRGGKKPYRMITDGEGNVLSTYSGVRIIKTIQTELTTLKTKIDELGTEQFDTAGYSCNYDHFSYEPDKFKGVKLQAHRVTAAVDKHCKLGSSDPYQSNYEKYYKTVSDHIPITLEINLK